MCARGLYSIKWPTVSIRTFSWVSIALVLLLVPQALRAQQASDPDCNQPDTSDCSTPVSRSLGAVKAYVTAPLRWGGSDWLLFGGAVAAIGVAHSFDSDVRTHFTQNSPSAANPHTLQDALPTAALFVGTWGFANLLDDSDGRHEVGAMLEATVLSLGTAYALNYASGRKGPDQTADSNRWWSGGSSFPSEHATAAFAIGTVLAESGNSRYRWPRRVLGYGVAGFTAYERLRHNAHWLSDTVAGAALGAASARFAMDREPGHRNPAAATVALTPLPHGLMLRYTLPVP
jgi:membrane-associated phospholipid phosphatase